MKKHIFFFFLIVISPMLAISHSSPNRLKTVISGYIPEIKNVPTTIIMLSYSVPGIFGNEAQEILAETKDGRFSFELEISSVTKYTIGVKNSDPPFFGYTLEFYLLIEPGDSVDLKINNLKDVIAGITINGKGRETLNYFKELRAYQRSYNNKYLASVPDSLFKNPTWWAKIGKEKRENELAIFLKHKPVLSSLMAQVIKKQNDFNFITASLSAIEKSPNRDAELIQFYRDNNLSFGSLLKVADERSMIYSLWSEHRGYVRQILKFKFLIDKGYAAKSKATKEEFDLWCTEMMTMDNKDYFLGLYLSSKIKQEGLTDELKSSVEKYLTMFPQNNMYRAEISSLYNMVRSQALIGEPIPNFSFKNSSGKDVALSDFKGKVLLLDLWYTGCTNCIAIQPSIKEIEERFKGSQFQVVSISIDKDRDVWLKNAPKYTNEGSVKLYTGQIGGDHPFVKYFNYSSYPTLILLGKNGEVVVPAVPKMDTRDEGAKVKMIALIEQELAK